MSQRCAHRGELILLHQPARVLCTKSSRKRARNHPCDGFRYLCHICALGIVPKSVVAKTTISFDLMVRLRNPNFVLLHSLTWDAAQNWEVGCRKSVANHLCNADGSVVDKDDAVKEVCGAPCGYGYFWFCEDCLRRAGIIW